MALSGEIIDFIRLHLLDNAHEAAGIRHITIVKDKLTFLDVRILIKMIDAIGIEQGGATLDAVDDIPLMQQEFREIRAVLAGDAGNESYFGHLESNGLFLTLYYT